MIIRRAKRESSVVDWMERVSDNQYSADVIISTVLFPSYFSLNFVALPRPSCPNDVSAVSEANGTMVPV